MRIRKFIEMFRRVSDRRSRYFDRKHYIANHNVSVTVGAHPVMIYRINRFVVGFDVGLETSRLVLLPDLY